MKKQGRWDEMREAIGLAFDALATNRLRSFLTVLGIVIGITMVVSISSVVNGLNTNVVGSVEAWGSNLVICFRFPWVQTGRPPSEWFSRKYLQPEWAEDIALLPGVEAAAPSMRTLFPNGREDPIGGEVLIEGKVFTVAGVLEPQKQAFGAGNNPEDNIAIMPLTSLKKLHPEEKEYVIFIKAKSADLVPQVVDSVRELLRRKRKVPSNKPDDFAIFTPDVFIDLWNQITIGIFTLMFALGSVGLLVGGIGVMNIMLVSVTERTREIGIRKAIGAKKRNILSQFLVEAVTLSLVGGVIGVLLGSALGLTVRLAVPGLPARVSLFWITLGLGVASSVGIIFGIYPAWKAAKLDPVEALRYE
ncbi:MAG: ABC transporter permease [Acidobacteria bacterium]|nr:ABC transporter permease [Acidobacteriota bacterium]